MAAAVCSADHCQTGPLGGRALAGFCETAFFCAFAAVRPADFFADFFAAFAPLFRLIHAEIQNFPDLARFYGEEVVARGQRLLAGIISKGIESGEFRDVDPTVIARMLAGGFLMHGMWCSHRDCFTSVAKKTDDQVLDELIEFYLHAIKKSDAADHASRTRKS